MEINEVFKKFPESGFLKITRKAPTSISKEQKAALVRKGNALFNKGDVDQAKKIFLTIQYSDGLIRIGDYYMDKNKPLLAFRMYYAAKARSQTDAMIEKMAHIISLWVNEKGKKNE